MHWRAFPGLVIPEFYCITSSPNDEVIAAAIVGDVDRTHGEAIPPTGHNRLMHNIVAGTFQPTTIRIVQHGMQFPYILPIYLIFFSKLDGNLTAIILG
jgi:hypothetical protein